jgi:hypothetical protein
MEDEDRQDEDDEECSGEENHDGKEIGFVWGKLLQVMVLTFHVVLDATAYPDAM